jgi:rod shape-determining protein MreC
MKQFSPFFLRVLTRKAQRLWVVFLLLLALLLVLFSPEIQKKTQVAFLEQPVVFVLGGVQNAIAWVFDGLTAPWDRYLALVHVKDENRRLTEEVQRLRSERTRLQEQAMAGVRLRELLEIRQGSPVPTIAAQVIGRDPSNWYRMAVLDKGEKDGIAANLGVISADGVVGRVIKTAPHFSRVLLITDRSSALAALVQRTRVAGILEGKEGGKLGLQYIPLDAEIAPGDLVLTSGQEGIFPKGLPVGRITRVGRKDSPLFLDIEVEPTVHVSSLEEVLVLRGTGTPDFPETLLERKTP